VLPATPTSSNTFYLAADTSSSATGSYKISLLREVANGFTTNANAPVGVIQSGVFEYSNDVDVYRTFLENGATYKISLEGNGSKDSISGGGIQVFASDGAQVASKVSFVDSTLEFSAPKNGEYFVAFSSNGSGENYNFRVDLSGVNGKTINGTSGNDTLRGSSGEDRFDAGKGDDFVILGDADDNARGGYGNDTIYAGAGDTGNDYLEGNAGNDILGAGAGNDMIDGGDGNDVIFGGAGNDKAEGGSGSDTIWAGTEDDSVLGEDGNDILGGGEGVDTVGGGIGNDVIYGASGIDMISGGGGDDTVFGGAGNDRITGDEGNDALYGGAGNDVFVFASGHGQDSIGGFKTKGDNTIDLTALGLSGFSDLTVTQSGSDVLISTGQGAITLWSTIVAELGAEDFLF
jgi:Ca2+-binding RTX toxin-like protein